jgi:integrase
VIEALKSIESFGSYFFWAGNDLPKNRVADWQRTLERVFRAADVKGHPHRFRTTVAVAMLEKGVAIESVSMLLGHPNITFERLASRSTAPAEVSRLEIRSDEAGGSEIRTAQLRVS